MCQTDSCFIIKIAHHMTSNATEDELQQQKRGPGICSRALTFNKGLIRTKWD